MFLSLATAVIVILFLIKRVLVIRNPVYIYKNKLFEDRPIELIGELITIVFIVTTIVNSYVTNGKIPMKEILILASISVVLFVIILLEHNKFKVGVYENGILYRSIFHKWKKIYSYRYKELTSGEGRVVFYLYDSNDNEKLNKFNITTTKEEAAKIIEAIGDNLDPTRS